MTSMLFTSIFCYYIIAVLPLLKKLMYFLGISVYKTKPDSLRSQRLPGINTPKIVFFSCLTQVNGRFFMDYSDLISEDTNTVFLDGNRFTFDAVRHWPCTKCLCQNKQLERVIIAIKRSFAVRYQDISLVLRILKYANVIHDITNFI